MHDHLPSLIPFLLDSLKDPHVREGYCQNLVRLELPSDDLSTHSSHSSAQEPHGR